MVAVVSDQRLFTCLLSELTQSLKLGPRFFLTLHAATAGKPHHDPSFALRSPLFLPVTRRTMRLALLCSLLSVTLVRPIAAFPTWSQAILPAGLTSEGTASDASSEFGGWYDPRSNGGRLLDVRYFHPHIYIPFSCGNPLKFTTKRHGEPLNVIISALSDPEILSETGFRTYAKSLGFDAECLGLHVGHIHEADLGDGDGRKGEQYLARQSYFPMWGTCWEGAVGELEFLFLKKWSA
jgi:hypothetical protein